MRIITLVLNAAGEPHFQAKDAFDAAKILKLAAARAPAARREGAEGAAAAIPRLGQQLVEAVNSGEYDDVGRAIVSMTMACWLLDSIYGGMAAEAFARSDLRFVVRHDGAVSHTYVPAGLPDPGIEGMAEVDWPDLAGGSAAASMRDEPNPATTVWPPGHPFADLMPTDAAENIYYADLFRIEERTWMILGYGKSHAARIASGDELDAMYGTDSIALLRREGELWARYDPGALPRSTHKKPGLWTPRRVDAIAYCLDEAQTLTACPRGAHTLIRVDAGQLASLCATYPYPAYMAPQFFSQTELARLNDRTRMQRRFAELTRDARSTDFLLVPHMPSVEEKAALYVQHRFGDAV